MPGLLCPAAVVLSAAAAGQPQPAQLPALPGEPLHAPPSHTAAWSASPSGPAGNPEQRKVKQKVIILDRFDADTDPTLHQSGSCWKEKEVMKHFLLLVPGPAS